MSALTVLYFILPFPLAFIIHELEEIIVVEKWMSGNKDRIKEKFPSTASVVDKLAALGTKGFAIAASVELAVIVIVTLSILVGAPVQIWAALNLAFTVHLIIHIAQALALRSYVPGIVSSVLLLPYFIIGARTIFLAYSWGGTALCLVLGCAFAAAGLWFAQWIGKKLTEKH